MQKIEWKLVVPDTNLNSSKNNQIHNTAGTLYCTMHVFFEFLTLQYNVHCTVHYRCSNYSYKQIPTDQLAEYRYHMHYAVQYIYEPSLCGGVVRCQ